MSVAASSPIAAQGAVADPESLTGAWRILRIALDILIAALLFITLIQDPRPQTFVAGACFAAVYLAGAIMGRRLARRAAEQSAAGLADAKGAPTPVPGTQGLVLAWLVVLLAVWTVFALISQTAVYLSFPLFFVAMQVAAGAAGIFTVLVTTALAIGTIGHHGGWTLGAILGPIIGASAALATGLGFRLLLAEAHARAAAISELIAARNDVAQMSRRAGELDERARLAGDIHDTVAQGLSSIQLLLHAADDELSRSGYTGAAVERVRLARTTAADNLAETRRIIAELQPAPLAGADVPVALARICATTPLGNAMSFHVDGQPTQLAEATQTALVRIAQTLIGNIVRHSGATSAAVTLTFQTDEVCLDVVDNGCGFDPQAPTSADSFGLSGARRRAEALGGAITIESAPGEGCGVQVRIPTLP
ncbi:sensor histidine kinase [Corynebacterium sp. TAE3-ERU12]|uniref:sensor histidine kinase n=1 Tax=Corynebacterium sp. TAE3-ERU12 TaxID=2849491 RepID=UPI001C454141|nr:sensor histidine kinase [Corynebacterium sp. TAE3-ERU12]MBV7294892.1 sensor histidine kinase [Corynebacterium sp. TAE3-ERU12]